jgi:hypothetical protein
MHAVLLTVLALTSGNGASVVMDHQVAQAGHHAACSQCGGGHGAHGKGAGFKEPHWQMPQTCYNPKYGCYAADRHMNRYPAFHGTYYRRPYNYRNVFDYPWHAELHEPTSFFSYHTQANQQPTPPVPTPSPAPMAAGPGAGLLRR